MPDITRIAHGLRNELALYSKMQEFHIYTVCVLTTGSAMGLNSAVIELESIFHGSPISRGQRYFCPLTKTSESVERFCKAASARCASRSATRGLLIAASLKGLFVLPIQKGTSLGLFATRRSLIAHVVG
jgi:hypothetical protein